MSETIKAGSVVRLKSDGAPMTVRWIDDFEATAFCEWFTQDGGQWRFEESEFLISFLECVPAEVKDAVDRRW